MFPTQFPGRFPSQGVGPSGWALPQRPMMQQGQGQMPTMPTLPQQATNANSQAWWRNGMSQPGQPMGGQQASTGGWADRPAMPSMPQLPPQAMANMQGQMPTLPPQAMQGQMPPQAMQGQMPTLPPQAMQGQMPTFPPQGMQGQMPTLPEQAIANMQGTPQFQQQARAYAPQMPFTASSMPGQMSQMPAGLLSAPAFRR